MSAFQSAARFLVRAALAVLAVAMVLYLVPLLSELVVGADPRHAHRVLSDISVAEDAAAVEVLEAASRYKNLKATAHGTADLRTTRDLVQREIAKLNAELGPRRESRPERKNFRVLLDLALTGELVPALKQDLRVMVRSQERDALKDLDDWLISRLTYDQKAAEVERRRLEHVAVHERREANEAEQADLCNRDRVKWCHVPLTEANRRLSELKEKWSGLNKAAWSAHAAWAEAKQILDSTPVPGAPPEYPTDQSALTEYLSSIRLTVVKVQEGVGKHVWLFYSALRPAALIVVGSLLVGVGIKALLFFILAPMASKRPPIRLGDAVPTVGGAAPQTSSAVALDLTLDPDQELLVKGDYLQSVEGTASTSTKFVLNSHYPISSLASGMWLLTSVRPAIRQKVVISSTNDPLSEISALPLTTDEVIALQPQHLVGAVHAAGTPIRIRSVWRFGPHAWLTMQFRYLTFRGPATLLVKGCRGVRVEDARRGVSISQSATIGFSTTLGYSTAPSETFIAYLLAQKPFFNDRFFGDHGYVAYQEVPRAQTRTGFTGRSLQGLMDGFMKAFGI